MVSATGIQNDPANPFIMSVNLLGMFQIIVDDDVKQMIIDAKQDFRICTACRGPVLVPVSIKPPKASDVIIPVGDQKLYVSRVQADYIDQVSMDMLCSERDLYTCPAFPTYRRGRF